MEIEFTAELWIYPGQYAWHFITVPTEYYSDLKQISSEAKRGFGSIRVEVTIGKSSWNTSIFPDNKNKSYLLPIKKEVRTTNSIDAGDMLSLTLEIANM